MHDWNNEHSMVFRCEATWKERDAITRRFRRQANLSRFRDAASRDARRGPRIVVGRRRKRAAAARGSAAASEPKIPEASARKAKRAKREGAVCVCGVNRLFTQVRHTSSWPGKSYLKNNSRSFEIGLQSLRIPRSGIGILRGRNVGCAKREPRRSLGEVSGFTSER